MARRARSSFLVDVDAGPYTVRGVSLGGIYTSLQVPQLGALFDVGMPIRAFAGNDRIFLSHGHGDHAGALFGLLGIRGLLHRKVAPQVFLPEAIAPAIAEAIGAMERLPRHGLPVELVPMKAGDERQLRQDLWVRAFRTHHPVPSLGYLFFDRVKKLDPALVGLPGPEIARRKAAGEAIFAHQDRLELAYATDTLVRVLETSPEIAKARVLILECTFLDERKSLEASRAGCHIHLDELLEVADRLENEHIVLMHFSQLYAPREVHAILAERLPPALAERVVPFAPPSGPWPG
ncbi:MAG: MBL fold metallo-hydrolase [Myxococcota bacterium]